MACIASKTTTTIIIMLLLLQTFAIIMVAKAKPVQLRTSLTGLRQVVDECRNETNAIEADFEALLLKELKVSRTAKCLRACLMKKINSLNMAATFTKDMVMHIAKESVAADDVRQMSNIDGIILDICIEMQVSDDHCEAAEQYGKCASEQLLKNSSALTA